MSARVAGTLFYYNQLGSSMSSDPSCLLRRIAGNFDQGVCKIMDLHPTLYNATELADFIKKGSGEDVVTRLNALFEQLRSVVRASQSAPERRICTTDWRGPGQAVILRHAGRNAAAAAGRCSFFVLFGNVSLRALQMLEDCYAVDYGMLHEIYTRSTL